MARKFFLVVGFILAFISPAFGYNKQSAAGFWQTIDPSTNKVSAIVQIWRNPQDGMYYGRLYRIFNEGKHKSTDICIHCKGPQQNESMLGLTIISRMVDMDKGYYQRGRVLDPRDGSLYHAQMRLVNDGETLHLRGYILIPLFGKTASWDRATSEQIK